MVSTNGKKWSMENEKLNLIRVPPCYRKKGEDIFSLWLVIFKSIKKVYMRFYPPGHHQMNRLQIYVETW